MLYCIYKISTKIKSTLINQLNCFSLVMNFWIRLFLQWLFGSPKEYRIPKGGSVLVIEIGKNYVRYFKLKKPDVRAITSK